MRAGQCGPVPSPESPPPGRAPGGDAPARAIRAPGTISVSCIRPRESRRTSSARSSSESEWRWLQKEFDEARSREAMLRESGYLPEDPPAWETARSEPPRAGGSRPTRPAGRQGKRRGGRHCHRPARITQDDPIEPAPSDRRRRNDPADRGHSLDTRRRHRDGDLRPRARRVGTPRSSPPRRVPARRR